jgi:hypothetical protein
MSEWADFCAKPPARVLEFSKKHDAVPRKYMGVSING